MRKCIHFSFTWCTDCCLLTFCLHLFFMFIYSLFLLSNVNLLAFHFICYLCSILIQFKSCTLHLKYYKVGPGFYVYYETVQVLEILPSTSCCWQSVYLCERIAIRCLLCNFNAIITKFNSGCIVIDPGLCVKRLPFSMPCPNRQTTLVRLVKACRMMKERRNAQRKLHFLSRCLFTSSYPSPSPFVLIFSSSQSVCAQASTFQLV